MYSMKILLALALGSKLIFIINAGVLGRDCQKSVTGRLMGRKMLKLI
jgi:hypothetical protein